MSLLKLSAVSTRQSGKPQLGRLSDAEIKAIFRNFARDGCPRCVFLEHYAESLLRASPKDFTMLRPISLILIGKYDLGAPTHFVERRSTIEWKERRA